MKATQQRSAQREGDSRLDFRLKGAEGDILLEIKRTSAAVELRGVLLSLAYLLDAEPPSTFAVCMLKETRLTIERVKEEISRFRANVHPDLAGRVYLVLLKDGEVQGELPPMGATLLPMIIESALREAASPPTRVTQQVVKTAALQRWLSSRGRLGVADMQRATGASMPTVIAAFRAMQQEGLVYAQGSGYSLVDELPWDSVRRMVEAHASERRVIRFMDPSGHARDPLSMAERLRKMQSRGASLDVDLGGVIGAQQYYADLNITAAPRLDLCVYDGDASFVGRIDAGLLETTNLTDKAVLVLHMTRDTRRGPRHPGELRTASEIDCLADLLEIGLQAEAIDFWQAMDRRRRKTIAGQTETVE
jgi:hypothetical protein